MNRSHLAVALVVAGALSVLAGLWVLSGPAVVAVVAGAASVAVGLLMETPSKAPRRRGAS